MEEIKEGQIWGSIEINFEFMIEEINDGKAVDLLGNKIDIKELKKEDKWILVEGAE